MQEQRGAFIKEYESLSYSASSLFPNNFNSIHISWLKLARGAIKYKSSFVFSWFGISILLQLSGTCTETQTKIVSYTHTNTHPARKFTFS